MLVLSRKKGETIEIDGGNEAGGVTLTVVEVRGDNVRIGLMAPKSRVIHRGEIARKIREEASAAYRAVAKVVKALGRAICRNQSQQN